MTKEQIIENYKKARHITDGYVLNEDEMYFVEQLVEVHAKLASNTEIIGSVMPCFTLDEIKEKAEKWSKSRSQGDDLQDIDCMYDFAQGMREMQRLLTNKT